MVAVKKEITNVAELAEYFDKKGDLHDCVVDLLHWWPSSNSIEIRLLDVNANFLGLPEYEGAVSCMLRLKDVTDMCFSISNLSGKLRVYEAEVSPTEAPFSLKMLFSPSGSMGFSFTEVDFLELT